MANSRWNVVDYGYCFVAYGPAGDSVYYLLDVSDWKRTHALINRWSSKWRWATNEEFRRYECPPVKEWKSK